jgi:hypothetical protein
MKRIIGYLAITTVAAALVWGQRGRGGGVGAGSSHGAPVTFPPAAKPTNPNRGAGTSQASTTGGARTADVGARLAANPVLSGRIQPLLPSGTTVTAAAAGFRNQGEFLAAVHVSKNLGIPFQQLKTEMTGTSRESLGKAIRDLRPTLDDHAIKRNVKLAERQAKLDAKPDAKPAAATEVSAGITRNPRLAGRVADLLPRGTTLQEASDGFRNQGQFIAALHVSRNLGIPFDQLKAEMLTGRSLGQAIADLRPARTSTEVAADVRVAERETRIDVEVTHRAAASTGR